MTFWPPSSHVVAKAGRGGFHDLRLQSMKANAEEALSKEQRDFFGLPADI